jgi:aminoglycoside phosphotransferase (APT) family kinase protein
MQKILDKFGITQENFLGAGNECKTFQIHQESVVKIYSKYYISEDFYRLQEFYKSLDTLMVNFRTPNILSVDSDEEFTFVVEEKLPGIVASERYLLSLPTSKLYRFIDNYIEMMFSVRKIKTNYLTTAQLLDTKGRFYQNKKYTDWKNMLLENLILRYLQIRDLFDGNKFDLRYNFLINYIQNLEYSENALVHGDISHLNLLIDEEMNIVSVYDFNGLTTIGDVVFDLPIAWAALQRFQSLEISKYAMNKIFDRLNSAEKTNFAAYMLINCFITANMFVTNDINEPHFKWCLEHLNNKAWWEMIGFKY